MVEIRSSEEVTRFLEDAPLEWAQIIILRTALRVFPLCAPEEQYGLTLSICRALFISWAAVAWPAPEIMDAANRATVAIANAYMVAHITRTSAGDATNAALHAVAIAGFDAATAARFNMEDALGVALHVGIGADTASAAAAAADTVWSELGLDATRLREADGNSTVLHAPLWTQIVVPSLLGAWSTRKAELMARTDEHWSGWVGWYDRLLTGESQTFFGLTPNDDKAFCIWLASESNIFWERPAAAVNKEILDRLTELRPRS